MKPFYRGTKRILPKELSFKDLPSGLTSQEGVFVGADFIIGIPYGRCATVGGVVRL